MKRLIVFIMAIAFVATLCGTAIAQKEGAVEFTLYLSSTANTGVTTAASGTSTMVVAGGANLRSDGATLIHNLDNLALGTCVLQVQDIDVSQGVKGNASGNYSGATFTVRYRESAISGTTYQEKALPVDIITGMALSGNTLYQVEFYPVGMGDIDFQLLTGITPFDRAVFKVRMLR